MGDSDDEFDIEQIKLNALSQGVSLRQIAIIYKNLTEREKTIMQEHDLIASDSGDSVIGRFTESGDVFFQEKASGVLYLGA